MKTLMMILIVLYVVSPVDLMSGIMIDDILILLLAAYLYDRD